MLPLRFPKIWAIVGWLLVIGVVVGSLAPADTFDAFELNDKVLHAGTYLLLMMWFAGLYRRPWYPLIAGALLALGIGMDLLQGLTRTRSLDWYDMVANAFGIALGLAMSVYVVGGWCQRLEQRLLS